MKTNDSLSTLIIGAACALGAACSSGANATAAGADEKSAPEVKALEQAQAPAANVKNTGNEQYFPLQSYRVGPYAAGGTGFFGGFIDYLQLVNARDGGVNGVKLTWSECETEYAVESGVEC